MERGIMKKVRCCGLLLCLLVFLPISAGCKEEKSIDSATSLVVAPGWEEVNRFCTRCHAGLLIAGNRADREGWLAIIRRMEKEQGMKRLDPEIEKVIIDYLATHYAPGETFRRPPLEVEFKE
jgi:hypothetical protein